MTTTWGSKNAEDLFEIATRLAGFDRVELMMAIQRRLRGRDVLRVNVTTVESAMGDIERGGP